MRENMKNHVDPEYFEKAVEMHYNPSGKETGYDVLQLGCYWVFYGTYGILINDVL
jgi:hypothetical protein